MGQLIGAVFGMALFGAAMAWIIRFVFRSMPLFWSYALGLAIFVWPAAWSWTYNHPETSFVDSFLIYGFAGVLAFPALVSTSLFGKKGDVRSQTNGSNSRKVIFRLFGWIVFSILTALGATCIFAAFRGSMPDASLPFFFGALFLIGAVFLLKALSSRTSSAAHQE